MRIKTGETYILILGHRTFKPVEHPLTVHEREFNRKYRGMLYNIKSLPSSMKLAPSAFGDYFLLDKKTKSPVSRVFFKKLPRKWLNITQSSDWRKVYTTPAQNLDRDTKWLIEGGADF